MAANRHCDLILDEGIKVEWYGGGGALACRDRLLTVDVLPQCFAFQSYLFDAVLYHIAD